MTHNKSCKAIPVLILKICYPMNNRRHFSLAINHIQCRHFCVRKKLIVHNIASSRILLYRIQKKKMRKNRKEQRNTTKWNHASIIAINLIIFNKTLANLETFNSNKMKMYCNNIESVIKIIECFIGCYL